MLHLVPLSLVAVAAATCDGWDPPAEAIDCSEEASKGFYDKRIAPLLDEERPSSCNQCHLAGVDLAVWVQATPCETMACMVEEGLVDLDDPSSSLVLSWIDRAEPQSEGITASVIAEEKQGVLEWIEREAACGGCANVLEDPCGRDDEEPPEVGDCDVWEGDPDTFAFDDPGDCSDKTLEGLFQATFFPFRRRCWPCHFESHPDTIEDAPKWIAVGECATASLATYRNVQERGYIDVDTPSESLWILKPLEEELGGLEHGGGPKFHSVEEPGVPEMLYFSQRYADCMNEAK